MIYNNSKRNSTFSSPTILKWKFRKQKRKKHDTLQVVFIVNHLILEAKLKDCIPLHERIPSYLCSGIVKEYQITGLESWEGVTFVVE